MFFLLLTYCFVLRDRILKIIMMMLMMIDDDDDDDDDDDYVNLVHILHMFL